MTLLKFTQITEEAKLRTGLSHVRDLKHEQFKHLLGDGHVHGHVTEKSDGMAFEVGHDEHGFYSRTSRSERMRHKGDYAKAAHAKFGASMDPKISGWHDDIHHHLHQNEALQKHLRANGGSVKGEIYHKPQGQKADEHHVRFVGTAYDTRKMGKHGSFVVHTRLPENASLKKEHVHKLGDDGFRFSHDDVGHKLHVNASDLHKRFHELNHEVLHSRKKADAEGKAHEKGKFEAIKNELHARIASKTSRISPKWGPETEGHVVHPVEAHSLAPRIKIVDGNFMARKKASEKFVKEEVITEGGNVHIGDQKTVPIKIEDRDKKAHDVDEFMHSVNHHSGGKIFGGGGHALKTGSAYSGSSRHMMDKSISSHDLGKYKKSFGDVDVMVPHHSEEHVVKALQPGTQHGKFTVQGVRKIGAQHSAVVKHADGSHHQIDFEYKDHDKNHEPTKYSQWSQNSHIGDMKKGLKGVFHKHLVNSVTTAHSRPGVLEKVMKKGVKHEDVDARNYTFSPSHGMRVKHVPKMVNGQHEHIGGKPVFHEVDTKDAHYDRDLGSIHHKLFGVKPTAADTEHLHSFHGTAHLIKKHFDHGQRHKIVKSFVNKLYGTEGRPHESVEMKDHAIHALKHHFPDNFDKGMHEHIAHQKKVYFDKNKINESAMLSEEGNNEKHVHIAMAAGRFTGPTVEHQKLIDNVLKQKADHHHIFVMGPADHTKTTEKDPLTVHEKLDHLKTLYPHHKHVFVPGTTVHTKTPAAALSWMHFRHKHEGQLHLHVVAGEGDAGVEKNAGGSIDNYKNMTARLNGTKFPVRTNEHGQTVGGDHRMNYKSVRFVAQKRGTTSGSAMRKYARDHDPENHEHVAGFRKLLHKGIGHPQAKKLMNQIKHFNQLHESTVHSHWAKGQNILHHQNLLKTQRKVSAKRPATSQKLALHADKAALRMVRNNVAGLAGKPYSSLSKGQKVWIDSVVQMKAAVIDRLGKRMMLNGTQRMKDHARQQRALGIKTKAAPHKSHLQQVYNIASEAYDQIAEEAK